MRYLKYSQTLILKSFGAILALALTVILNNVLDEKSFGQYSYITSVATFLSTIILFGNAKYIIAELPKVDNIKNFIKDLHSIKSLNIIIFFILLSFIFIIYSLDLSLFKSIEINLVLMMLFISYFLSRNKVNMSILRASNLPIFSELPEIILKPLLLIISILIFGLNKLDYIVFTLMLVVGVTYFIGNIIINRKIDNSITNVISFSFNHKLISRSLIVFFITIVTILNENLIIYIMPYFLSYEFIGYFKIFSQLALLLSFGMMAVNIPQAYVISKKILEKNHDITKHLISGLNFSLLYYIMLIIIYILFGRIIIELLFGDTLVNYLNLFYTMTLGQLIYIIIGPMGQILILSKNYKNALTSLSISLLLSIIISIILIFKYGFNGACYSYLLNLTVVHINFAIFAYKNLKIKPSILYLLYNENKNS